MDTLFFWLSKALWAAAAPGSLLVLSVAVLWTLLKLGAVRAAGRLAGLLAAGLLLITLFPVDEWLLYPLESRFSGELPATVDGILVLGGSIDPVKSAAWSQPELRATAEREFNFLALAARYPKARLAFTGGSGSLNEQEYKEASWARELFARQGLEPGRVIFESDSRNTYENAVFSKKLLAPAPGEHWLLITTAWHMPRAVGAFCGAGFPVIPYPVDHGSLRGDLLRLEWDFAGNLGGLDMALHEWAGLFMYRLTGKMDRLLPAACGNEATQ
ncbi:MAG TPA: YdcF family protein [Gammaproteobacteria bacterium]|nr:YdcF family protein [Gammaproteobacteria bacterium]